MEELFSRLEDGRILRLSGTPGRDAVSAAGGKTWNPSAKVSGIEVIEAVPLDAAEIAALISPDGKPT